MCEYGDTVTVEVSIPAELSHSGVAYSKPAAIDRCIAPLVRALNGVGLTTIASCCGHGRQPGRISLAGGREVLIVDYEQAGRIAKLFPPIAAETEVMEGSRDGP